MQRAPARSLPRNFTTRRSYARRVTMPSKDWRQAVIAPQDTLLTAMRRLNESSLQILLVVDEHGRLVGTLTDGDIRRGVIAGSTLESAVSAVVHGSPRTGAPGLSKAQALDVMRRLGIHALPLVDPDGTLTGLITLDDAMGGGEGTLTTPVVIMAGGRGERLRPMTDERPKPLIEVHGEPLIDILIRRLVGQGFTRLWLAVHYRADLIEKHVGSGLRFDADIRYLQEEQPLGTAGALSLLPPQIDEPLLVMNADVMNAVDFAAMVTQHGDAGAQATVAVFEHTTEVPFGVMITEGNRLMRIEEKPRRHELVNAGVYVLDQSVLRRIPPNTRVDMPTVLDGILANGGTVHVHRIDGYWLDIGTPAALARAHVDHDLS